MSVVAARRGAPAHVQERCAACGAVGRGGQLICLSCGERMALGRREARGRRPAALIAAAIGLVAAAAIAIAAATLAGDDGSPAADAPRPAAASPSAAQLEQDRAEAARRERARRARARSAGEWPAGRTAYTVVLLNAGDRGSAERFARTLTASGEKAGVIAGEKHSSLGSGLFLVFSGVYETEAEAASAAARLAETHAGAYPQRVEAATGASSGRPDEQPSP